MTGRVLHAALHLLDHQLVDREGVFAGKVDDAEIRIADDGAAELVALLSGPGVLARRQGHETYGRWRERVERAIDGPRGRTARIPWHEVRAVGPTISVAFAAPVLASFGTERWVGDHLIGRIPGARHVPDHGPVPGEGGTLPETPVVEVARREDTGDRRVRVGELLRRRLVSPTGEQVGHVLDVRLVQDGPAAAGDAALRVDGLLIGHGRMAARSGLLRHRVHGPALLRAVARLGPRRHYVRWTDVMTRSALADGVDVIVDPDTFLPPP